VATLSHNHQFTNFSWMLSANTCVPDPVEEKGKAW